MAFYTPIDKTSFVIGERKSAVTIESGNVRVFPGIISIRTFLI
jgi:hypothetical protein